MHTAQDHGHARGTLRLCSGTARTDCVPSVFFLVWGEAPDPAPFGGADSGNAPDLQVMLAVGRPPSRGGEREYPCLRGNRESAKHPGRPAQTLHGTIGLATGSE